MCDVPQKLFVLLGGEEARRDGVAADAAFGEVHRQPLGEVGHAGLCRAVRGDLGQRREGVHRADVEDASSEFNPAAVKVLTIADFV